MGDCIYKSVKGGLKKSLVILGLLVLALSIFVYADNITLNFPQDDNITINQIINDTESILVNETEHVEYNNEANMSLVLELNDSLNYEEPTLSDELETITENQTEAQPIENELINENTKETEVEKELKPLFAEEIDGKSAKTKEINEYFKLQNNFSNIEYKTVNKKQTEFLKVGAKNDNKKGYIMGDKIFAVHLVTCEKATKTCSFRINGVRTGKLSPDTKSEFNLNENHTLTIKNIKFNYCDGKRFCNMRYEAYDKVEVEIE